MGNPLRWRRRLCCFCCWSRLHESARVVQAWRGSLNDSPTTVWQDGLRLSILRLAPIASLRRSASNNSSCCWQGASDQLIASQRYGDVRERLNGHSLLVPAWQQQALASLRTRGARSWPCLPGKRTWPRFCTSAGASTSRRNRGKQSRRAALVAYRRLSHQRH